ncbi:type II secretion system protein N [Halodesulfovibrio aestuarii]|uniref:type II secretion system protein N n=1 Tax=Halodesulfovibrio aestuarii TaxID=126333 RepID=UPI0004079A17
MSGVSLDKIKIFIELGVIIVSSYFMANACFALFFAEQSVPTKYASRNVTSTAISERRAALSSFELIEQRNLLKVKNVPPAPERNNSVNSITQQALSVSQRGFYLLGTICAETPSKSWAIVLYKNKQSLYRYGSTIGGWKITDVKRREIILLRGKVKERLLIDAKSTKNITGNPKELIVARSYVKNKLKDVSKVASSVRIVPQTRGKTRGLYVQSLQTQSFLYDMGLRKGDLLINANGTPLTSFGDAASLMSMLEKNDVSLNIIRNGKSQTLTFRLK